MPNDKASSSVVLCRDDAPTPLSLSGNPMVPDTTDAERQIIATLVEILTVNPAPVAFMIFPDGKVSGVMHPGSVH